jgi:hypothetical protein
MYAASFMHPAWLDTRLASISMEPDRSTIFVLAEIVYVQQATNHNML